MDWPKMDWPKMDWPKPRFGQKWIGQNWIGQNWSNQDGQKRIGHSRSLPCRLPCKSEGIFKDVRFYPILNFGHFWAPLAFELPRCQERWSIDFLGVEGRRDHRKEGQEGTKHYSPCFLVKTSPAEGRRRFHKNTAYARLGV